MAVLALVACAGCGAPESAPEHVMQGALQLDVAPGDPVDYHGLIMIAPEPGFGVWEEELRDDGAISARLETLEDASVWLFEDDVAPQADDAPIASETDDLLDGTVPTAPPACKDPAYTPYAFKWTKDFEWYFKASTTPSYLSQDDVEALLKKATNNITNARNNCGLANTLHATNTYMGRTTAETQWGNINGINTVEFGPMKHIVLGHNKLFTGAGSKIIEADIRLNSTRKWVAFITPSCNPISRSIEAVMTHERGHTFGLGHVSETLHGNLTMSTRLNGGCENAEATLGLGDVKGLRSKYAQ